jgi:subtilisin family serine protease/subtilisin-like proprotein convertase family protein
MFAHLAHLMKEKTMRKVLTSLIAVGFVLGAAWASAPRPDNLTPGAKDYRNNLHQQQYRYASDRLIIKLNRYAEPSRALEEFRSEDFTELHRLNLQNDYTSFQRVVQHGVEMDDLGREYDLDLYYKIEFSHDVDVQSLADQYSRLPEVSEAYPDYLNHIMLTPNDYYYSQQWAHHNTGQAHAYGGGNVGTIDCDIDSDQAWDLTTGAASVTIAIIDTGVDLDHTEFSGKIVAGYDFVNNDSTPQDDHMHGTACAGIAAALGNNTSGVAGVSFGARIMPLKVLDSNGSGYNSDITAAIDWARTHGADVISMSLGGGGYDSGMNNAINAATSAGLVVVSAAGNDDSNGISYPANYSNSMAVGALSPCNERKNPSSCDGENWWGSNYGSNLDVMAPGTRLHTTYYNGGYIDDMNGTSGATPHVAGVAALVKGVNPSLSATEIRDIINNSADDIGAAGFDIYTGHGRLNAYQAVLQAGGGTDPIISYQSHTISDGDNGQLDPGETANLYVTVVNNGAEATGVSITLSESSSYLSISSATQYYGTIAAGGTDTNSSAYVLTAAAGTPLGTTVTINMSITANGGYSNTDSFDITIGTPPSFTECNSTNYSIPDNNATGINSPLNITEDVDITDLRVYVDITHTWIGDLLVRVTSPSGTQVVLHNRSGGSDDNIVGWYDTELSVDGPGSLDDFLGESSQGSWTLHIDDNADYDTGTLNEWCLYIEGQSSNPNTPPVVTDIPNQTVQEGQNFSQFDLDNYVSDAESPDADLTWSYSGNSSLTVSINASHVATVSYPSGWTGSETITFTATDPGGLSDSDPAIFWLDAVNDPPVVSDIPNQSIQGGESFAQFDLDDYVTDVDNNDSQISWTYAGNSDLTVSIDGNHVATVTYPAGWTGSETITFTAMDTGGLEDSDDATFTVSGVADIWVDPTSVTVDLHPGETTQRTLQIGNSGNVPLSFSLSFAETGGPLRNITGSYVACDPTEFSPGTTADYTLSMYCNSDDNEWLAGCTMTFPAGVTVNSASDFTGGSQGDLVWDGTTGEGVTVTWWDPNTEDYGNVLPGETAVATINLTVASDFTGDMDVDYTLQGDTYGSDPHYLEDMFTLTNLGVAVEWFDYSPGSGNCGPGAVFEVTLDFDATDLEVGTYTGDLTITSNDPDESPLVVPITLNVSDVPAPDPVTDLVITTDGNDVVLTWSAAANATGYAVYRMLEPYDTAGAVLVTNTTDVSVVLTDELTLYPRAFYLVIATN